MDVDPCQLLIVGGQSDPNTCRIVDQAHLRDVDYVFWDTDLEQARQIAWDFQHPTIDLGDRSVRPKSIYLRYNVFGDDATNNHAAFELCESFAHTWTHIKWLNRSTAGDTNNKSRNLKLARQFGFAIPDTIVIGDATPLINHPAPENTIVKPLSGGDHAHVVREIQHPERLLNLTPQFVQEKLDGENLRIFSIGGELTAFHLQTNAVDYRTDDSVVVRRIVVPSNLRDSIEQLVSKIGFDYCALDFRCRDGFDEPVFLEINSFPMFVAFDDACENQLADQTLAFLVD
ncbi:ATP-grasp domain-containing protein [Roseiconus lacunae]|uniref:ATP-grasp domain-containing protein n=1 Tax=Roseiconus lacunae TaxID=2605694 RepID=UPI001E61B062|nr:hypothetical protein [Roseiconus lacunae]MCD0460633.1 hypothetical protein [Roseiconus lacunae]